MKFLKKNLPLVVILAVFAVGLGVSIFMLKAKIHVRDDLAQKLEAMIGDRQRLWDQKSKLGGSLSADNVKLIKSNTENEKKVVTQGIGLLRRGTMSFEPLDELPAQTKIRLSCQEMAKILDQSGIKHPDKFWFGFEKYSGFPPKTNATPMIQKQLKITEEIIKLTAAAPVQELTVFKRVVFEDAIAAAAAVTVAGGAAPAASGHSPATEPMISLGSTFGMVDAPGYLYTVMPFQIEVVCDTDSLRNFLNSLAHSEFILIPRMLNIANDKPGAMAGLPEAPVAEKKKAPPGPGAPGPAEPTEDKVEPVQLDPDELPYVLGQETIKVGMRIDYLEFRPEPKVVEKGKSKTGGRDTDRPAEGKR